MRGVQSVKNTTIYKLAKVAVQLETILRIIHRKPSQYLQIIESNVVVLCIYNVRYPEGD